ncbi:MAG: beta-lactamase family protein [Anaerolineaceae bacterium]|nr:beta-lactamase family protein [Anaerolineaceae bacterium]
MEAISQEVDQIFAQWDSTVTPGCALAVVRNGEIVYKRGYGMANLEYGIPITPATIFHIASVSKQFTALAMTLLAHEGKLSLDEDVRKHVPELPDFGETITIRHLIHHTSGLRDQWELLIAAGWRMDDVITTDDIMELVTAQQDLNFKPGEKHLYSNTGYTLQAVIVQNVTGKNLRAFCEERMFKPLGMKNTHFHDDHKMIVRNRAYSYELDGYNHFKNAVLSYANVGATSLFTTVEDLALWDQEFYDGKVFGKDVIEQMLTRGVLNSGEQIEYAHGLMITDYRGLRTVGHSGGDAGYRTHLMRFPDQHFSVIVFSNLSTVAPADLTKKVADIYLADEFKEEKKEDEKVIELPQEKLEGLTGVYFNAEDQATYRLEMRDDILFAAMGPGIRLEPIGERRFRFKPSPFVKLEFDDGGDDGELKLKVRVGAKKPDVFLKVDVAVPAKEDLDEYVGEYISPELDVKYTILIQEEQLMLKRRKYGMLPLLPTVQDGFSTAEMPSNLFFKRGENGQVTGFEVASGRVRGLRFVRQ